MENNSENLFEQIVEIERQINNGKLERTEEVEQNLADLRARLAALDNTPVKPEKQKLKPARRIVSPEVIAAEAAESETENMTQENKELLGGIVDRCTEDCSHEVANDNTVETTVETTVPTEAVDAAVESGLGEEVLAPQASVSTEKPKEAKSASLLNSFRNSAIGRFIGYLGHGVVSHIKEIEARAEGIYPDVTRRHMRKISGSVLMTTQVMVWSTITGGWEIVASAGRLAVISVAIGSVLIVGVTGAILINMQEALVDTFVFAVATAAHAGDVTMSGISKLAASFGGTAQVNGAAA